MLMRFSWDFHNRYSFHETIKMRETPPMLTSKLHILLNILDSMLMDLHEISITGILLMGQSKWVVTTLCLLSKLHILLNIFSSMLIDFHETSITGNNPMLTSKLMMLNDSAYEDYHDTSITGIPLMRQSKWGVTSLC